MGKEEVVKRWAEYFQGILCKDHYNGPLDDNLDRILNPQPGEMDEDDPPPDREEIVEIVSNLKLNKAPGIDGMEAELLKYGGEKVWDQHYQLIYDIWSEEEMRRTGR